MIGGPPCQGFSTAGARNESDPRNKLIFNYLAIVSELKPRWFIFENVEGLLTSGRGDALHDLVVEFLKLGYSVRVEKVNLAAFGIPQTRKRVIIVGNRLGVHFELPGSEFSFDSGKSKSQSSLPAGPSLADALAGLPPAACSRSETIAYASQVPASDFDAYCRRGTTRPTVSLHFSTTKAQDAQRFAMLSEGQTMRDLPEAYWHASFRRRAFRRVMDGTPTEKRGGAPSGIKRLHGKLQSLTITGASSREFIHPAEHRTLTLRECARIQSFPDCYEFVGGFQSIAQQIGNAFPPLAAWKLADHLSALDGAFGGDGAAPGQDGVSRLLGYKLTEAVAMSPALQEADAKLRQLEQAALPHATRAA